MAPRMIFANLFAHHAAFGFAIAALQIGNDAFERLLGFVGAGAVVIDKGDLLTIRAMQDHLLRLEGKLDPGHRQREIKMPRQRLQRLPIEGRSALGPGCNGAILQTARGIGNNKIRADLQLTPQTITRPGKPRRGC